MKGVVFNILEDFICENWGDEIYEEILSLCPLKTKEPFVGPGTYPDGDLMKIAAQAAELLGLSLNDALKAFGRFAFSGFVKKFPELVANSHSARDFLLSVDSVIHVEVKKLYPDAETPKFTYQDLSETQLIMTYQSKRNLCVLMEGLIAGVSDHFDTEIVLNQVQCVHQQGTVCEFDLRFV